MKPVVVAVAVAFVLGFLAAYSFRSAFSGAAYIPQSVIATPSPSPQTEPGGALRRSPAPGGGATAGPNGFRGPQGTPYVKGPSGPPPSP